MEINEGSIMNDGQRVYPVDILVLHHSMGPDFTDASDLEVQDWFDQVGKSRGYQNGSIDSLHEHPSRPGQQTYSMAQFAGVTVTDPNNKYGYKIVELIKDPWNQVAWHCGNWPKNQRSVGIENCGDFRYKVLTEKQAMCIADFYRFKDIELGGNTHVFGHLEISSTECPAQIMNGRDVIVDMINNPDAWNERLWPTPVQPAPIQTVTEPAAPVPAVNPYVKLEKPMDLIVNKDPTNVYNLAHNDWDSLSGDVVKTLPINSQFIAVGKYNHPLGGVYFMTEFSFGNADITGTADHTYGINTVDLSPAPISTAIEDLSTSVDDSAVIIPVKVIPPDPNKWQNSFIASAGEFIATQSVPIKDLTSQLPDLQLVRGQVVHVGGTFIKDGIGYYRTRKGILDNTWYGIPLNFNSVATLTETDDAFILPQDVANVSTIPDKLTFKQTVIKFIAIVVGSVNRFLNIKKGK